MQKMTGNYQSPVIISNPVHIQQKTLNKEKHQMSTKRGKRMKGKHSAHKNNYMDNLSGKQQVKQVKISGDG